jgi:hypothetical protein
MHCLQIKMNKNINNIKSKMNINFFRNAGFKSLIFCLALNSCDNSIIEYSKDLNYASIFPDYKDVVIPPNIAPFNFNIKEKGSQYHVEIYSVKGSKIILDQTSPKIEIPVKSWHKLLMLNTGNILKFDIYVKNNTWTKYTTINDSIASDPIESYMAYRLINVSYIFWKKMGIYQRNLENFDESPVYINSVANNGCVNCHAFSNANPRKMVLHFRQTYPGSIILSDNKLIKLNTKTKYTMSSFVYPAWHPGGNYIAFSVNIINLYFTANENSLAEVSDKVSDIVVYNLKNNTVTTSPKISTQRRENSPAWSPDGKWLYFISAPPIEGDNLQSRNWTKYSLLRIPYDTTNNTWGDVDTVLSSNKTGLSISSPVISPDGRYVLFCMAPYGYFTVFDKMSDLYILDLETNQYHRLDINSNSSESYHCFSRTGRWILFSSKRLDDIYSRPFIAYFDKNGKTYKPFILPQKDPLFYLTFTENYNRPELIKGKIDLNPRQVRDVVYSDAENVKFDTSVKVDALSGATWIAKHPK